MKYFCEKKNENSNKFVDKKAFVFPKWEKCLCFEVKKSQIANQIPFIAKVNV